MFVELFYCIHALFPGFRYCLNVLGTGQMRNFVQGELALYVGPVTVTARFPEPSSSQYPMRTPPLSQLVRFI